MMVENNVNALLKANDGNYFTTARVLEAKYNKGILTEEEYLEHMDVLAAKGMANGWA